MKTNIACGLCGSEMNSSKTSVKLKYGNKELEIKGVDCYICKECGEETLKDEDIKMIESLYNSINKPELDILNDNTNMRRNFERSK